MSRTNYIHRVSSSGVRLAVALLVAITSAAGCIRGSPRVNPPPPPPPPLASPLAGFVPIVPTSVLPLGRIWDDGSGPRQLTAIHDSLLAVAHSYSDAEFLSLHGRAVDIKARILKFLHLAAAHGKTIQDSLRFEKIDLVGVADLTRLSPSLNQYIIFQGLRVTDLAYSFSEGDTLGVTAALDTVSKNLGSVSVQVGAGSSKTVRLRGGNLFVGMRVIGIGFIERTDTTVTAAGASRVPLAQDLALEVGMPGADEPKTCTPGAVHDTSESVARLWVVDESSVNDCANVWGIVRGDDREWHQPNGLVITKPGDFNRTLRLAPVEQSNLYITTDIVPGDVTFRVDKRSVTTSGNFRQQTRRFHLHNLENPRASGWTY